MTFRLSPQEPPRSRALSPMARTRVRPVARAGVFTLALSFLSALAVGTDLGAAPAGVRAALAAEEGKRPPKREWSFSGPFGTYDRASLQRGLQVYREVCAACHGVKRVAFRNLSALGYSAEQIKSLASEYQFTDGPNDEGDFFERPGLPSDRLISPFPNDAAARAANGGALPPDLSLIVKARAGGADYLHALLVGYRDPPPEHVVPEGLYYNPYYPAQQLAMAPPLAADQVEYADGTPATLEQLAADVTHFLAWTAEPEMEQRKAMGLKVLLFLIVFAAVMYFATRRVWSRVE